jgi:hypothetical protein
MQTGDRDRQIAIIEYYNSDRNTWPSLVREYLRPGEGWPQRNSAKGSTWFDQCPHCRGMIRLATKPTALLGAQMPCPHCQQKANFAITDRGEILFTFAPPRMAGVRGSGKATDPIDKRE